ncbi:MAG: hypothetical protein ACI936_004070 [Paraglaciecola sp.]|jgi:hypothetical protein
MLTSLITILGVAIATSVYIKAKVMMFSLPKLMTRNAMIVRNCGAYRHCLSRTWINK